MNLQSWLTILLALQFIVVVFHDMVDIPGWVHGKQVQAAVGRNKFWIATLVNAIFPGLAVGLAIAYLNQPAPHGVKNYWLIYCGISLLSAITMWYVPYLLGCDEERKRFYNQMYAGTHQILPKRGDNPRPNLFHIFIHILFIVNLTLVIMLRFG